MWCNSIIILQVHYSDSTACRQTEDNTGNSLNTTDGFSPGGRLWRSMSVKLWLSHPASDAGQLEYDNVKFKFSIAKTDPLGNLVKYVYLHRHI